MDEGREADLGEFGLKDVFPEQLHQIGVFEHEFLFSLRGVLEDSAEGAVPNFRVGVGQQLQQIFDELGGQGCLRLLWFGLGFLVLHQQLRLDYNGGNMSR